MAIANILENNKYTFTIIGRDINQLNDLTHNKMNKKYSNHIFKNHINTKLIENANFNDFDLIFYCLPSTEKNILKTIHLKIPIVITSKGFKHKFLFEEFNNYAILSGGSYSSEILNNIPCYVTLSSLNKKLNLKIKKILEGSLCIISTNENPKSIELLGIYKNIISLFCGIINKLEMGKNIESAFICKCISSINEIIKDFDKTTIIEPAGLGDLFLSCTSTKSRNYTFGIQLVENKCDNNYLAEGYNSLINLKISKNNKSIEKLNTILDFIKNRNIDIAQKLLIEYIFN